MCAEKCTYLGVVIQRCQPCCFRIGWSARRSSTHWDVVFVEGPQHQCRSRVQVSGDLGATPLPLLVQLAYFLGV